MEKNKRGDGLWCEVRKKGGGETWIGSLYMGGSGRGSPPYKGGGGGETGTGGGVGPKKGGVARDRDANRRLVWVIRKTEDMLGRGETPIKRKRMRNGIRKKK